MWMAGGGKEHHHHHHQQQRCKTPDSPEGARGPVSPSQSSPVNGSADSLTPPPPPLALSLLDTGAGMSGGAHHLCNHPASYATCITRPLVKVKRFLSTLAQFGNDISPDIGECVRTLILNLVSTNLSIEDFHQSLQDVTNFPLRPFVLPFLRAHLPLLQREIHTLARTNKQSALQYVRSHDHLVLDPAHSPTEPSEIFLATTTTSSNADTGGGGGGLVGQKRRSSDSTCENGVLNGYAQTASSHHTTETTDYPPLKRPVPSTVLLTHQSLLTSSGMPNAHFFDYGTHSGYAAAAGAASTSQQRPDDSTATDEWRSIHVMLNCILSMVEKTKRALTILQQRNTQDVTGEWMRKQDVGVDLKRAANDILVQAVRQTEERVAEVKRRAEDAVNDVKRQAVLELQKAVAIAESKANELVAVERAKMDKILAEQTRRHSDEALVMSAVGTNDATDSNRISPTTTNAVAAPSQQNCCWNCGRKAHETCSGCSVARYCGPFCQHKDWENHHQICSKEKLKPLRAMTTTTPTPTTTTTSSTTTTQQSPQDSSAKLKK